MMTSRPVVKISGIRWLCCGVELAVSSVQKVSPKLFYNPDPWPSKISHRIAEYVYHAILESIHSACKVVTFRVIENSWKRKKYYNWPFSALKYFSRTISIQLFLYLFASSCAILLGTRLTFILKCARGLVIIVISRRSDSQKICHIFVQDFPHGH